MSIAYRMSEQDFSRACELASNKRLQRQSYSFTMLPAVGGMSMSFAAMLAIHGLHVYMGLALMLSVTAFVVFLRTRARLLSAYRVAVDDQSTRVVEATASGVRVWAPATELVAEWRQFAAFGEDKHGFVLLHGGDHRFVPVPKVGLSAGQIARFRSLLEAQLPRS